MSLYKTQEMIRLKWYMYPQYIQSVYIVYKH